MLRKVRRLGAVVMALAMIFVLSVGACAAFVSKVDTDGTADGAAALDGFTATFSVSANSPKSVNYYLDGDALNAEFWNNSNAYIEIDLTLNSAADDVYAILPAFTSTWGRVNPSVWDTYLVNGSTVTLREPLSTYYSEFKNNTPLLIRAQICSNSETAETVEITVSGLRFVGVDGAEAVQPDDASVPADDEQEASVPDDTSAEESGTPDEPADEPADESVSSDTSSAPAEDDTSRPITTTTQPSQTTTKAPASTTAAAADSAGGSGIAGPIIIIVVVVVVIAAAAVGFIIYRKKKFY